MVEAGTLKYLRLLQTVSLREKPFRNTGRMMRNKLNEDMRKIIQDLTFLYVGVGLNIDFSELD